MSVLWACLIATSNLQMCIPQLIILAKGKFAIAAPSPSTGVQSSTATLVQRKLQGCPTNFRNLSLGVAPASLSYTMSRLPISPIPMSLSCPVRCLALPSCSRGNIHCGSFGPWKVNNRGPSSTIVLSNLWERSSRRSRHHVPQRLLGSNACRRCHSRVAFFNESMHSNVEMSLAALSLHSCTSSSLDRYDTRLGNGGTTLSWSASVASHCTCAVVRSDCANSWYVFSGHAQYIWLNVLLEMKLRPPWTRHRACLYSRPSKVGMHNEPPSSSPATTQLPDSSV
jgi:hypothetical protein